MKILITGGAGFIGSNLVDSLINDSRVTHIRVLDNLVSGFKKNIEHHFNLPNFEFIEGDIRNVETCLKATKDIDVISHQAALGSVPRSIKDPLTTNDVNISGTLNIFNSAVQNKVKRVVFAASSSTYGDSEGLPKVENIIGKPLSPYAVTKYVNELYADVFSHTFDFEYIGLRYFNVFGPKQDPNGPYAAVIPLFFKCALENKSPTINGDGSFSRDFTYVDNAVQANILSIFTDRQDATNQIYNVACGERTTLNELWDHIRQVCSSASTAEYGPERVGDIPHSLADITKIKAMLNYQSKVDVKSGIQNLFNYMNDIRS